MQFITLFNKILYNESLYKLQHFNSNFSPIFRGKNELADQTGIEPAISSVTGRHVNRYTTGPTVIYYQ